MGRVAKVLAISASILLLASQQVAQASFFGYPRGLKLGLIQIQFDRPALPPLAHTRFCLQYPKDCKTHAIMFRGGGVRLTPARLLDLVEVNAMINRAIRPEPNTGGVLAERWLLYPRSGDCNDYAVTKRHELIKRGWPARALLLAEVVTTWGEHHLVLVVRTRGGDFVADSLTGEIRRWSATPYQWVRIQSPQNPQFWSTISGRVA